MVLESKKPLHPISTVKSWASKSHPSMLGISSLLYLASLRATFSLKLLYQNHFSQNIRPHHNFRSLRCVEDVLWELGTGQVACPRPRSASSLSPSQTASHPSTSTYHYSSHPSTWTVTILCRRMWKLRNCTSQVGLARLQLWHAESCHACSCTSWSFLKYYRRSGCAWCCTSSFARIVPQSILAGVLATSSVEFRWNLRRAGLIL